MSKTINSQNEFSLLRSRQYGKDRREPKSIRMDQTVIKDATRIAKKSGGTFSDFVEIAVIEKLERARYDC